MTTPGWLTPAMDEQFFHELEQGLQWQAKLALRLLGEGLFVRTQLGIDRRPLHKRYLQHVASVDVELGISPESIVGAEVKSIRFPFGEGGEGHPFPTTFVGPVSHWQAKERSGQVPALTFIVSRPTGNIFWVPTFTRELWETQTITDHRRDVPETNYAAPKSCWYPWETLIPLLDAGVVI